MRFKMMVLAAAVSFTLPAVAQTAAPAATTPKKEKKICRRFAVTGSIIATRTECHSAAEWATIDAANASGVESTLGSARPQGSRPGS